MGFKEWFQDEDPEMIKADIEILKGNISQNKRLIEGLILNSDSENSKEEIRELEHQNNEYTERISSLEETLRKISSKG